MNNDRLFLFLYIFFFLSKISFHIFSYFYFFRLFLPNFMEKVTQISKNNNFIHQLYPICFLELFAMLNNHYCFRTKSLPAIVYILYDNRNCYINVQLIHFSLRSQPKTEHTASHSVLSYIIFEFRKCFDR